MLNAFVDDKYEPVDLCYFFGPEASSVRTNPVLYPDASSIRRATMEHDWGDRTRALDAMWSRVKGEDVNAAMAVIISVLLSILLGVAYYRRFHGKEKDV